MRLTDEGITIISERSESSSFVRVLCGEFTIPVDGLLQGDVSLVEVAGRTYQVWSPSEILDAVQQREELFATAYPGGVAIPHPRNPLPDAHGESVLAFGRTLSGIPFGGAHGQMSDLFFFVLCKDSKSHLAILARLGRMLQSDGFLDELRERHDSVAAYDFICQTDEQVARLDN